MTLSYRNYSDNLGTDGIAIIGMACLFPGAKNLATYFRNIIAGVDAIRDVSSDEWTVERFFNSEGGSFDKTYCKSAGFISEYADFNPMKYGIMPNAVNGADPDQFIALKIAFDALDDAGYLKREFNRDRAEIILGRTSAPGVGSLSLIQRGQGIEQVIAILEEQCPELTQTELSEIRQRLQSSLPPCNADTIAGVMPNVLAGRIANKLGFRGRNLILDAACASSLIALENGVKNLLSNECDLVLTGGIHINSSAYFFQMFCGLGALSHSGKISPFGADADGTLLGEGAGMVVLKRYANAIADGDKIYAVIRGTGSSSDGYGTSVLAPSVEGEALAMERAYQMANISPRSVGLLEGHGTGTIAGDLAEMQAIEQAFGTSSQPWCALGSVKSMIGHTQAASGIAGLIKTALCLYHRVLPPTLNVKKPNPKVDWSKSPCYINTRTRPWIHPLDLGEGTPPRRAAVSAFGFGGINAHVILEESKNVPESEGSGLLHNWESELCIIESKSSEQLLVKISELISYLNVNPSTALRDIAFTLNQQLSVNPKISLASVKRLCIIANSVDDLSFKLNSVREQIAQDHHCQIDGTLPESQGIYFSAKANQHKGKLAFILPGLGAAYPNMLSELCIHFPEVRAVFDYVERLSKLAEESTLPSFRIFPIAATADNTNAFNAAALASMDSAVVTMLMAEFALFTLLKNLGINPDALLGCSTGEFAAITMMGAVNIEASEMFYRLSTRVSRSIPREALVQLSSVRVNADYKQISKDLEELSSPVYLTADLAPQHIILTGSRHAIKEAVELLKRRRIDTHPLPIAIPYHTALVQGIVDAENPEVQELNIVPGSLEAWSCSTSSKYPHDVEQIRKITTELFAKPIQLRKTIEAMYQDGVRLFVEVGPKGGLTSLVTDTLKGMDHLAVAADVPHRSSITQLNHLLAALACNGVPMDLDYLYKRRSCTLLDFSSTIVVDKTEDRGIKLGLKFPEISLKGGRVIPSRKSHQERSASLESAANRNDHRDLTATVMNGYLQTLESFHGQMMDMQQNVMRTYLEQSHLFKDATQSATLDQKQLPFLRGAVISFGHNRVSIKRKLDLNEDLFLLDHAIGGYTSTGSQIDDKVYLLPLMVALELMAEAASLLTPNLVPARIENVRAYRRIRIDESGFDLKITALSLEPGKITTEIKPASSIASNAPDTLMSCEIVFAPSYPQPPSAETLEFLDEKASSLNKQDLYGLKTMFHGPRMQAVTSIDRLGSRDISGRIAVRQPHDWFASDPALEHTAPFLLDPLLLDNASQLVLFHLFENKQPVSALLPFYIESIEFYKAPQTANFDITANARLVSITEKVTEARVNILDQYNKVWIKIKGINSRRILPPSNWLNTIYYPDNGFIGNKVDELSYLVAGDIQYWSVGSDDLPNDEGTLDWCADYVLGPAERNLWITELKNEGRKREWLSGRLAAKEAVRALVDDLSGLKLKPADVQITSSTIGIPVIEGNWINKLGWKPVISISHKNGVAFAAAAKCTDKTRMGIDVEEIIERDQDFEAMFLSSAELELVQGLTGTARAEAICQFWCAKEAAAKALGLKLADCLTRIIIQEFKPDQGELQVAVLGGERHISPLSIHSTLKNNHVLAIAIG